MRGLGQGLHILDWLDQVTFPVEARFADATYARKTYENTVNDFLRQGITTASYYGSRHAEATRILRRGIKVGLGTDNGGVWASQMLAVIRQAMIASDAREVMSEGQDFGIKIEEAFHLATMGGANVMSIQGQVGNFEVGKTFDAVWVSTTTGLRSAMTSREDRDSLRTVFEKFVMTGDDRNLAHVYVNGRRVAGAGKAS